MKRPWKVPLQRNSKLQSCLALSLGLHLLVLFGLMRHERVTQYPVLPQIMVKFTKRPPPQRSLTRRQLGVNIVVYALTREGSLARQLVAAD